MKTFEDQNQELVEFDLTFDPSDFESCVKRGMLLIRNREVQMKEEGYQWPINTDSCKWTLEQAVLNRSHGEEIMGAVISYVESVEYRAESFNGIN